MGKTILGRVQKGRATPVNRAATTAETSASPPRALRSHLRASTLLCAVPLALATAFSMSATMAQAQTLEWDGPNEDGRPAEGGNGDWNDSTRNWVNPAGDAVVWTDGSDAVFGGFSVTVRIATTSDTVEVKSLKQESPAGLYTFRDGTIQLGGDVFTVFDIRGNTDIVSQISDGSTITILRKTNTGVLSLQNVNNNYTGGTIVDEGILEVTVDRAAGSGNITLNGTGSGPNAPTPTLSIAAGSMLSNNVRLNFSDNRIRVSQPSGIATLSGIVFGSNGGFAKTGSGTLALTGKNEYGGATTIREGTLLANNTGDNNAIPDKSVVFISNGATFELGTHEAISTLVNRDTGTGTVKLNDNTLTVGGNDIGSEFSGTIEGMGGGLTKQGTGTFAIISSTSTYSGATRIEGGVLRASGGNAIGDESAVVIREDATFELLADETIGSLSQFAIGNAGAVLLNEHILTAGGDGSGTRFEGTISGTGGLTKTGAGFLDLSGANSYEGPTRIEGGELSVAGGSAIADTSTVIISNGAAFSLGGDETIGSLDGDGTVKVNPFTLTFGADNTDTTFAGSFTSSGGGELIKTGTGTFTYAGQTPTTSIGVQVNDGTFLVNGRFDGPFTVANGATLGGSGAVGSFVANGTIAPGNSIGMLRVTGDATFNPNSVYEVEIAANGTDSDLIDVTGTAKLDGWVRPITTPPEDGYIDGAQYTILTASSISGRFADVDHTPALLDYTLEYDATNVYLNLAFVNPIGNLPNFPMFATTPNQLALAEALVDFDFAADPAFENALMPLGEAELAAAYDSLSGEVFASGQAMAAGAGGRFTRFLMANGAGGGTGVQGVPLGYDAGSTTFVSYQGGLAAGGVYGADAPPLAAFPAAPAASHGLSAWAGVFGASVDIDGDGNASSWSADSVGVGFGLEADLSGRTLGDAAIGFGFGYSSTSGDLDARSQAIDIDSWHIGVYGRAGAASLQRGWAVEGAASYAYQNFDSDRFVSIGGINRLAEASYNGGALSAALEARYQIPFATNAVFAPLFGFEVSHAWANGFTETGAGALNLTVAPEDHTEASILVGAAVSGAYRLGDVDVTPSLTLAYERLIGADAPGASLSLAGSPTAFAVRGPDESRDRFRVGAAGDFRFNDRVSLNFGADAVLSSDRTAFSGKAGLKVRF